MKTDTTDQTGKQGLWLAYARPGNCKTCGKFIAYSPNLTWVEYRWQDGRQTDIALYCDTCAPQT